MVKHGRKRSQRSRRQRRQSSRRQSRRQQRGGASCAALPFNSVPVQQRGGMAPIGASGLLLDQPTMVQAQSATQMADIEAAVAMARSQSGGARRSRRQRSQHRQKSSRRQSRRQRSQRSRRQRSQSSRRQQRGGMMDFDSAFGPIQGPTASENAMWQSETQVNGQYLYGSGVHQLKPAA